MAPFKVVVGSLRHTAVGGGHPISNIILKSDSVCVAIVRYFTQGGIRVPCP